MRTTNYKLSGWIDMVIYFSVEQLLNILLTFRFHPLYYVLDNVLSDLGKHFFIRIKRIVLR